MRESWHYLDERSSGPQSLKANGLLKANVNYLSHHMICSPFSNNSFRCAHVCSNLRTFCAAFVCRTTGTNTISTDSDMNLCQKGTPASEGMQLRESNTQTNEGQLYTRKLLSELGKQRRQTFLHNDLHMTLEHWYKPQDEATLPSQPIVGPNLLPCTVTYV